MLSQTRGLPGPGGDVRVMRPVMIISCEHGGFRVPPRYRRLFDGHEAVLKSHRGYDEGAAGLARTMARLCNAELAVCTMTRLLVDCNRSLHYRKLFSEYTRTLPDRDKQYLLDTVYQAYRAPIVRMIGRYTGEGRRVLHCSVHSFTPVWKGRVRKTDIGLLYDPVRDPEKRFCRTWKALILAAYPQWSVRRNDPYRGITDGLVTYLRRRYTPECYTGVELEVNQRHVSAGQEWRNLKHLLARTFIEGITA